MKRTKIIMPYIIICFLSLVVFLTPFGSGDELWNYVFGRNISCGLIPYRDFNMVQTPLSAYISSAFIILFGGNLFSFRIAGFFLLATVLCTLFSIIKQVQSITATYIALLLSFSIMTLDFMYNYNYLTVLVILIIIKLEQTKSNGQKNEYILGALQAILIGLTPLIKQNTGLALMIANLVICLLLYYKRRMLLKALILRITLSIIPCLIYALMLFVTNTFRDFWNYTVEGISDFSQRFSPIDLLIESPFAFVLLIFVFVFGMPLVIKAIKNKEINNVKLTGLLLAFSFFSIIYPLCDRAHVLCALIPTVPAFILLLPYKKASKKEKYISLFVAFAVTAISIVYLIPDWGKYHLSDLKNYELIPISDDVEHSISLTGDYITAKQNEGYNVRIADYCAAAIKIPLDNYEKNWDMLLKGNLGTYLIDDLLKEDAKTLYLISNKGSTGIQNCTELIDYITRNYTQIDSIGWFDVYEKQT